MFSRGPNGSCAVALVCHGSFCAIFLADIPKKSKSSSKALSVCDVFPLLVNTDGLEFPSLPKLSTLTPSLERVVNVGDPGGLRSIKDTVATEFEGCVIGFCIWLVEHDGKGLSCFFRPKKLVNNSVGLAYVKVKL